MSFTASAARIAANKANAQRSTGPRTPEGKSRVSENAYKHGLRSERNPLDLATDVALPHERDAFEATLADFLTEFAPATPFETRLVERLAQIDLRLNRAIRMETTHLEMNIGIVTKSMAGYLPTGENAEQTQQAWLATLAFLNNPSATTLIAQYESRLSRDFARTLTQLRAAQNRKRTGPLAGASQERAPLSAMEEKSCNQTQPTPMQESLDQTQPETPHDPQLSAASNRGVYSPTPHPSPDPMSPAAHPPSSIANPIAINNLSAVAETNQTNPTALAAPSTQLTATHLAGN